MWMRRWHAAIEDLEDNKPDVDKLADAVQSLDKDFEPEDVTLYLSLAAEQWPAVTELDELWRSRLGTQVS